MSCDVGFSNRFFFSLFLVLRATPMGVVKNGVSNVIL